MKSNIKAKKVFQQWKMACREVQYLCEEQVGKKKEISKPLRDFTVEMEFKKTNIFYYFIFQKDF